MTDQEKAFAYAARVLTKLKDLGVAMPRFKLFEDCSGELFLGMHPMRLGYQLLPDGALQYASGAVRSSRVDRDEGGCTVISFCGGLLAAALEERDRNVEAGGQNGTHSMPEPAPPRGRAPHGVGHVLEGVERYIDDAVRHGCNRASISLGVLRALIEVASTSYLRHVQEAPYGAAPAGHEDNGEGWCVDCGAAWPCGVQLVDDALAQLRRTKK